MPGRSGEQNAHGRVLVVDDDQAIRELLRDVLVDHGYQVRTAAHGRAALDRLAEGRADLIVLDMAMPVMDGQEFRLAQLADRGLRDIPVVVLSATASFLGEEATVGAEAVLGKPFEVDDLLQLVDHWIASRGGAG